MSESKLQWIAIFTTALGLIITAYLGFHSLKAIHLQSELSTYLQLNETYNRLLFDLIQHDPQVFHKTDDALAKQEKYLIYQMFELFSTIKCLETHCRELGADVWPIWQKRFEYLCSKPAFQHSWGHRLKYAESIYKPEFIDHVNSMTCIRPISEPHHAAR